MEKSEGINGPRELIFPEKVTFMTRLSHPTQAPTVESVWCEDCGEVRPVTYDRMPADERNDHDATDILCDHHHVVATLHHPVTPADSSPSPTKPT